MDVSAVSVFCRNLYSAQNTKDICYGQLSCKILGISNDQQLELVSELGARVEADQDSQPVCLGPYGIAELKESK